MPSHSFNSKVFFVVASNQDAISNKNLVKNIEPLIGESIQQNEIQRATKWLINKGFIVKSGKNYQASVTGGKLMPKQLELSGQLLKIEETFEKIENKEIYIPQLSSELIDLIKSRFEESKIEFIISELKALNKEIFESEISGRMISAILKISDYKLEKFVEAINLTRIDWRDTLMQAGFGDDVKLHESWIENQINKLEQTNLESDALLVL